MYNKRQEYILKYLEQNDSSNRENIENFIVQLGYKGSKITILRDLDLLVADGLVEKVGKAKATIYSLSSQSSLLKNIDVQEYFNKDQDERVLHNAGFNFDVLKILKGLFTQKEKENLKLLNENFKKNKAKLSQKLLQKEFERLTVELAWKSSRIEGNTYTLLDTERLLKENISAKGKTNEETQMVLNHKKALDFILDKPEYYKELSLSKIIEIHHLLTDNLDVEKGVRTGIVGIVGTNYKPLDNAYQIKEALNELVNLINEVDDPVEKALVAVLMIAYIQPFEDGNKRTSRILGNALLLANEYCPLSYRSVDEVEYKKGIILFYEQNNASYFKKLFVEQFTQAVEKYFG